MKLFLLLLTLLAPFSLEAKEWETLRNCELVSSFLNDGDSFLVKSGSKEFVVRLYSVDAPEVSAVFPDRVDEQAAYFGISTADTLAVGKEATEFARRFMSGGFTVRTKWKDGWGRAKRYLAIVQVGDQTLSGALVENGLARIHGFDPEKDEALVSASEFAQLEILSRDAGLGGWGTLRAGLMPKLIARRDDPHAPVPGAGEGDIDLNEATLKELQELPGVGKVLASRLDEGRPWFAAGDIEEVKGIGGKTLREILPLVTVSELDTLPETANYYRQNRNRFLNRNVKISIAEIEEKGWPAPDGFVVLSARTTADQKPGGAIPLFIPENRLDRVLQFFSSREKNATTNAIFYDYQGKDVLVIPRTKEEVGG